MSATTEERVGGEFTAEEWVSILRGQLKRSEERERAARQFAAALVVSLGKLEGGGYVVEMDDRAAMLASGPGLSISTYDDQRKRCKVVRVIP